MSKARVAAIKSFSVPTPGEGSEFFGGMLSCLSPEEKCDVLIGDLFQPYARRAIIMRRIIGDMQRGVKPCHRELAAELERSLEVFSGKECVTCAMILLEIAE